MKVDPGTVNVIAARLLSTVDRHALNARQAMSGRLTTPQEAATLRDALFANWVHSVRTIQCLPVHHVPWASFKTKWANRRACRARWGSNAFIKTSLLNLAWPDTSGRTIQCLPVHHVPQASTKTKLASRCAFRARRDSNVFIKTNLLNLAEVGTAWKVVGLPCTAWKEQIGVSTALL